MTCDGCHAVAHQVSETFAKAHNDRRKDYVIKESDLLELFGEDKKVFPFFDATPFRSRSLPFKISLLDGNEGSGFTERGSRFN